MKENNMNNVLNEVKNMDSSINEMLVPILKDTIADGNRHNKRLFVLIMIELIVILAISITALFFVYKQSIKYDEFLSQFEFGTDEYTYSQDLDTHEGGDIIDPSINVNQ